MILPQLHLSDLPWRRILIGAAALVLAFAGGRFTVPTKTVTQTVDRVVYQDRVVTKTVQAQATERVRVVYRDRTVVTHPDGTVERRNVTETARGTATVATTSTANETEHTTERDHATAKTVDRTLPQWHVSALAAVDPLHLAAPWYGGAVERRILGPVWVGAFGLSSGAVGIQVSLDF